MKFFVFPAQYRASLLLTFGRCVATKQPFTVRKMSPANIKSHIKLKYSILSHKLGRSSGHQDGFAKVAFHLFRFSAILVELAKSISVHSFCSPPLLLSVSSFFISLCPVELSLLNQKDLETWPNHNSFRFVTRVKSSLFSPIAAWIFLPTSSLVTWSFYETCSSLQ